MSIYYISILTILLCIISSTETGRRRCVGDRCTLRTCGRCFRIVNSLARERIVNTRDEIINYIDNGIRNFRNNTMDCPDSNRFEILDQMRQVQIEMWSLKEILTAMISEARQRLDLTY